MCSDFSSNSSSRLESIQITVILLVLLVGGGVRKDLRMHRDIKAASTQAGEKQICTRYYTVSYYRVGWVIDHKHEGWAGFL